MTTLDELDEGALVQILTEPRNALTKQYQKLLSFDKVKLKFTDSALSAIARKAHVQKTGARGLRAILEEVMLDIMYDIPSQTDIREVVITEDHSEKGRTSEDIRATKRNETGCGFLKNVPLALPFASR